MDGVQTEVDVFGFELVDEDGYRVKLFVVHRGGLGVREVLGLVYAWTGCWDDGVLYGVE